MPRLELANQQFNRWTVIKEAATRPPWIRFWLCRCDCGTIKEVRQQYLLDGQSPSCGCITLKHGHARKGKISRVWHIWHGIHNRCYQPSDASYKYYGAKGIEVCIRWHEFINFLDDMSEPPSTKHTIERINSDGDYEPSNCRWATRKEQARNRSNNTLITFKDRTQTQVEWVEETGLSASLIHKRLQRGWSVEDALTIPSKR